MRISPVLFAVAVGGGFVAGGGIGFVAGSRDRSLLAPTLTETSSKTSAQKSFSSRPSGSKPETSVSEGTDKPARASAATGEREEVQPIPLEELRRKLLTLSNFWVMRNFRELADLQDRLAVSDLPAYVEQLMKEPHASARGLGLVFAAYAEKEPEAAFAQAQKIKNPQIRQDALSSVIIAIARSNPDLALALTDQLPSDQNQRQSGRSAAIMGLASQDPTRAIALLKENPQNEMYAGTVFVRIAQTDVERAKLEASRLTGKLKDQAINAIVGQIGMTDPEAAWEYAKNASKEGVRGSLESVIQSWAQTDPQEAMKAALTLPPSGSRSNIIANGIQTWAQTDFPGALSYVKSVSDSTLRSDLLVRMSSSSNQDSRALLGTVIDQMPAGDGFQQAIGSIFSNWARSNPAEAAAELKQLPTGRAFNAAAGRIVQEWSKKMTDQPAVLNWIRQLPEGEARRSSYQTAFIEWARVDPQKAIQKLGGLSNDDRTAATDAIASSWSNSDPQAVLRWSGTLSLGDQRDSAVRVAISQWAQQSPAEAAEYVKRLPAAQQPANMATVIAKWASKDTDAAADWLRPLPPGDAKDVAIQNLALKISLEDFPSALGWASAIQNGQTRNSQMETLARNWLRQDATAARTWISKSQLPPDLRQKLLQ